MLYKNGFPKQRLSYSEKSANDFKWAKDVTDNVILYSSPGGSSYDEAYDRKLSNYLLYNNVILQKDFERECNQLGIEVGQFKDEIKPYNKTYNKIQVLLGEELKRPFDFRTALVNSEAVQHKLEYKKYMLKSYMESQIAQYIQSIVGQAPQDPDQQQQYNDLVNQIVPPDKLDSHMASYRTRHERKANQILQYLIKAQSLKEKMNEAFKHGLIAGEEHVWVGVVKGEPTLKVLNPLGVFYYKGPDTKYTQEASAAGYRTFMTVAEILDTFDLSDEDVKKLEGDVMGNFGIRNDIIGKKMNYFNDDIYQMMERRYEKSSTLEGQYEPYSSEHIEVTFVEWISQKKVGFVTMIDPQTGDEVEELVSEEFKVPDYATSTVTKKGDRRVTTYSFDGMTLEWGWMDEVWQATKIGEDIYTNIGPRPYQYRSLAHPDRVFLSIHGITYNSTNAPSVSLMDRMKPFQHLYFVVMHKLKKLIAQDQGKVFHFDLTMIDPAIGLEKTMYYIKEMGIDFFNPLQNAESAGAHQRGKIADATDMSNMQFISNYIGILDALDFQISEVAGITRQREGFTSSHEAVSNAQQNILQSSTITEAVYFAPHYHLWERILNSLILCATEAWRNNKVLRQFVLDDGTNALLDIEPNEFDNADFGVFITNSQSENELFNTLKSLAQPLLQNDKASLSDIISIFKGTSASEIELKIKESETKADQKEMEQIQAAQQAQMQQIEAQKEMMMQQQQFQMQLQQMKDQAALEREIVKLQGNMQEPEQADEPTEVEEAHKEKQIEKLDSDIFVQEAELELKRKKLAQDKQIAEKQMSNQAKIAKMRPKTSTPK